MPSAKITPLKAACTVAFGNQANDMNALSLTLYLPLGKNAMTYTITSLTKSPQIMQTTPYPMSLFLIVLNTRAAPTDPKKIG